jgi:hypothetical protein
MTLYGFGQIFGSHQLTLEKEKTGRAGWGGLLMCIEVGSRLRYISFH